MIDDLLIPLNNPLWGAKGDSKLFSTLKQNWEAKQKRKNSKVWQELERTFTIHPLRTSLLNTAQEDNGQKRSLF